MPYCCVKSWFLDLSLKKGLNPNQWRTKALTTIDFAQRQQARFYGITYHGR